MVCPSLTTYQTGRQKVGQRSARPLLLVGGEVVAMCGDNIAQNRTGWPPFLSICLLVRRWRGGERLAMVWTVEAADGTEERRGTGKDGGGILRHGSLSSCSVCSFAFPSSPPEGLDEDEDEAGMMADRRGAALLFVCCWSIGGDVVSIASPRSGRGVAALHLALVAGATVARW